MNLNYFDGILHVRKDHEWLPCSPEKRETIHKWIDSLTEQQQRALAFQSGIAGWKTCPPKKLVRWLKESGRTAEIYGDNYG